jgi:predicted ribosomally synthesized peptide with SipW-like signal peptide
MKNIKGTLITVLAMLLVCVLSVSVTLAYLYDKSETVINTFSVAEEVQA